MAEASAETVFLRIEMKYLLSAEQAARVMPLIAPMVRGDPFGAGEVLSLYFDTPDFRVAAASAERPIYREKLRLRSYGVPTPDSVVFLEIKKKLCGVVSKRREPMTLRAAEAYIGRGELPSSSQIMREADALRRGWGDMAPAALISCRREAYFAADDPAVRITFDRDAAFRLKDLRLEDGGGGEPLFGGVIAEVKTPAGGAAPLWLVRAMTEAGALPSRFSKYGEVYSKRIRANNDFGGAICSTISSDPYSPTPSRSAAISSAR